MNPTILITGASSGIGKACAKKFQSEGWNVVATMRAPQHETELNRLDRVLVTRLDVQDMPSIHEAIAAALRRFGQVDALLNNAGYGAYGPLEATPLEKVRRQLDVNVVGLVATTQALLPHFRARRRGVIANVSSMGGRITFPLGSLYHASKFAVEGFSEALHYELLALGIRVKIIEPGAVRTDFAGRSFDFSNDPALTDYQPAVQSLLGALGPMLAQACEPEAVADVIFGAVTDGADRLRYEAGADAGQLLAARRAADDAAFLGSIRSQFGILPANTS